MTETTNKIVGYARASTEDQDLSPQVDALMKAGCQVIYQELRSGKNMKNLVVLHECLASLKPGDTIVVTQISRIGRNAAGLLTFLNTIKERNIYVKSIKEGFDTSNPLIGKVFFGLLAILSDWEREIISERTKAALQYKKSQGVKLGPKFRLDTEEILELYNDYYSGFHFDEIKLKYNLEKDTVYRYIKKAKQIMGIA